jgi:hypothetical protein
MQKLRIMTNNRIRSDITHLGHLNCQNTSDLQHHRQWKSKLLGRIVVIVSNVPFPHNYHFPNFVIISGTALLADHHSFNQTWVCALLFGIHILFTKFSFISKYLKQKLKNKSKILIFLKKHKYQTYLFKFMSHRSIQQQCVPRTGRFYKHKHIHSYQKNKKELAKSKTWKGGLGKKKSVLVDWKPERAIQAKVRDSKKKNKKSMTAEAHPWEKHSSTVCKWRLLPDFWLMGFIPKKCLFHHQLICVGPCPDVDLIHLQQCYPQWRLPSGCTVMSVHSPSYQPNLVSSSYYTVTPSYKYKFHTYIIHTFIHT